MKRLRSSGTVTAIDPSGSVDVLQQITDMFLGIQGDLSQVITEYNKEVYATLSTLPQGKAETRWRLSTDDINPRVNNLDGDNLFVDTLASSTKDGGRFWISTSSTNRPRTIRESFLQVYTTLTTTIDQLRTEIAALSSGNPIAVYNTSLTSGNLIESDVRSIVFDGTVLTASSAGTNAVSITSSGGSGGSGVSAPKIVVGNSVAGDTSDDCDYLDVGNGINLEAAITAAGLLTPPGDIYIRPGTYDLAAGSVTAPFVIPGGIRIRGAGSRATIISAKTNGDDQGIFNLSSADSLLEDVGLLIPLPLTGTGGTLNNAIVSCSGHRTLCNRVDIDFASGWDATYAGRCSLRTCFASGTYGSLSADEVKFLDCKVGENGTLPSFANLIGISNELACFSSYVGTGAPLISMIIDRCLSFGGDYGAFCEHVAHITNSRLAELTTSAVVLAGSEASSSLIQGNRFVLDGSLTLGSEVGIDLTSVLQCRVVNNDIEISLATAGQKAISLTGADKNIIMGNTGPSTSSWTNAVSLDGTSDSNQVIANNFGGTPTYVDSGTSNDFAHNI